MVEITDFAGGEPNGYEAFSSVIAIEAREVFMSTAASVSLIPREIRRSANWRCNNRRLVRAETKAGNFGFFRARSAMSRSRSSRAERGDATPRSFQTETVPRPRIKRYRRIADVPKVIGSEPARNAKPWPRTIAWTVELIYQALLAWLIVGTWWTDRRVIDPLNPAIFIIMWIVLGLVGLPVFLAVRGIGLLVLWIVKRSRSH